MERGYIMPAAVLGVSLCSGRGVDDGQLQVRDHWFRSQVSSVLRSPSWNNFPLRTFVISSDQRS